MAVHTHIWTNKFVYLVWPYFFCPNPVLIDGNQMFKILLRWKVIPVSYQMEPEFKLVPEFWFLIWFQLSIYLPLCISFYTVIQMFTGIFTTFSYWINALYIYDFKRVRNHSSFRTLHIHNCEVLWDLMIRNGNPTKKITLHLIRS